ncbi:MAG TPA: aldehyde dehydrogenase family protein, partial [Burkholderiaceae bacterium]
MNSTATPFAIVSTAYVEGAFVEPHGHEMADLHDPSTEERIGQVRLGDRADALAAIAAAKRAFPAMARTSKAERIAMLGRLHAAVSARCGDLRDAMLLEYGAPRSFATFAAAHAADAFRHAADTLEAYPLERRIGTADVRMEPVGVAALITPWNSNAGFICNKLAAAIAAGCTAVVKPSEMSALQTQVVLEALHAAGLPAGVFNVVNGRGDVVGAEFASHPDVAKVSFTGSTAVGKSI